MSSYLFNYSPGPAMLPQAVHNQVLDELMHPSTELSILELGHRRPEFSSIAEKSQQTLRTLLDIPEDYHVLFLAGGAQAQYAMVPINLANDDDVLDYVHTGHWSQRAIDEAKRFNKVCIVIETMQDGNGKMTLPELTQAHFSSRAAYCHYVDNETLSGFELPADKIADICPASCPVVSDMTSNFLTRRFDITKYGIIYSGAQKNAGIAGLAIVIIHRDLLNRARAYTPSLQCYTAQVQAGSLLNTPPIFAWYVCSLMLDWTLQQGGLDVMSNRSLERSNYLYQYIDSSEIYHNNIMSEYRSRNNICFRITPHDLEARFLQVAEHQGLIGLRGHRAVGGIRASLYNAMPIEGVRTLVEFMQDFEKKI